MNNSKCPRCGGTGRVHRKWRKDEYYDCPTCHGTSQLTPDLVSKPGETDTSLAPTEGEKPNILQLPEAEQRAIYKKAADESAKMQMEVLAKADPQPEADWNKVCLNCMGMGHTWDGCPDPLNDECRELVKSETARPQTEPKPVEGEEARLLRLEAEVAELRHLWEQNEKLLIKLKVAYEGHVHEVNLGFDLDMDEDNVIETRIPNKEVS